jgi:hypothetical protein
VKFSIDFFFHFKLLYEQLFFFLLNLCFLLFKLFLERNLLLLCNLKFFYEYFLHLLQGLGGLFCFLLCVMKVSFGHISSSVELGWLISQLWFSRWQGHSGHCTTRLKGMMYPSEFNLNFVVHLLLLGFMFLQDFL